MLMKTKIGMKSTDTTVASYACGALFFVRASLH